jgi:tetratricopeptide (TPR) repeat protein
MSHQYLKSGVLALLVCFQLGHAENSKTSLLEQGRRYFESGNYEKAIDSLSQTISSTTDANIRNRALYYQGLAFYERGLFYSSYLSFRNVLMNPDERFREVYEKAIKNAVTIADRMDLVDKIGAVIAKMDDRLIPSSVGGHAQFAKGVYLFNGGKNVESEAALKSVSPQSVFYPKAQYYLGIISTKKKNYKDAAYYFEKVVSTTRGNKDLYALEELGRLNLARTAYSSDEIEKSVELYSKFLSSSPYWIDVLLEASWPLMKMNDATVSLGNLQTITSPFYKEDLVGEAYLLRATILHRLCKYDEMRRDLTSFFRIYDPIIQSMEKEAASMGASDSYFRAYRDRKGLNRAFMTVISRDQGIQKNMKILESLSEERAKLSGVSKSEQIQRIISQIDNLKEIIARETGQTIKNIHKRKLNELLQQREQANYLKVEVVTGEKELIESQAGLPPKRVTDVETTVSDAYHFWPYNGEYWEDELGTYIYTTESSCVN